MSDKLIDEISQSIIDEVDKLCIRLESEPCFFKELLAEFGDDMYTAGLDAAIAAARKIQTEQYPEIYSYNEKTCPLCAIDKVIAALEALKRGE